MARKLVALIPARGGSRSIPLKNIKPFCGRPLIHWVLEAALKSQSISEVVVTTDSEEIARSCDDFNPKIKIFRRSQESATDEASTELVMLEFAKKRQDFDDLIVIQATSPWIKKDDIDAAYLSFQKTEADSLLTVTRQKFFLWREEKNGLAQPLNYTPQQRPRRQEWGGELVENGAFYITKRDKLLQSQCRLSGKIVVFEMELSYPIELDEQRDWEVLEKLMGRVL